MIEGGRGGRSEREAPHSTPESAERDSHDYAQLETIYAHLDSTTTVGATASSRSPQVGNSSASWGREVHRSKDGEHSTFVRNFGHGALVVTEVTWVN